MGGYLYVRLIVIIISVESKHYLYRSRYNWKPQWAEPAIKYNDAPVPPPCPGQGVTPCPGVPETSVSAAVSSTTTTTTTTLATTASTVVFPSSAGPTTLPAPTTTAPTPTSALRDCIADGGGICTASCNIGTFTLEDSSFSCEGNGIGSVCCLEP